jgi:uncharacterized membrane protein
MISIDLIHPMLVHFPIVFLITAVVLDIIVLLTKKDLAGRQGLPLISLSALLLGTLSAGLAAIFGDIALDEAVSKGFAMGQLEVHETLALITIAVFSFYCLLRLVALWRKFRLQGYTGWIAVSLGIAGVVLLIITAYYGGELVYHLGVNVAPVIPK